MQGIHIFVSSIRFQIMSYTQYQIVEEFEKGASFLYWDGPLKAPDSFSEHTVEYMSIFLSVEGNITFASHGKEVTADRNHVQMFVKDHTARIVDVSPGYRSIGIIFSRRYWTESLMHINPDISLSYVKPALPITPEERKVLVEFLEAVHSLMESGLPQESLVFRHLFMGMLFHLGEMYERWSKTIARHYDARLIVDFTRLLFEHHRGHRDVAFYAEALGMSRAAFSNRVKKTVGFSALHCIEQYVLIRICKDLSSTTKSMKEIAMDYSFHDTSHFCKFFRKLMGESPENYRKKSSKIPVACQ